MISDTPLYTGRFAPTPSGPLHLGSLMTALASYLEARKAGGRWLLRIDDLDAPRCRPEHADTIMRQLEGHGLLWDEAPRRQSQHIDEYKAVFDTLNCSHRLYRCQCTRAELADTALPGPDGDVYARTCLHRSVADTTPSAWRIRVDAGKPVVIVDRWLGVVQRDRLLDIGDFVVRRVDGQIGYQLACVIDDLSMAVTDVIRGVDLIGSSLRQVVLFDELERAAPRYGHLPILTDDTGRKLSKQNHARPIDPQHALHNLQHCLQLLGQQTTPADTVKAQLDVAVGNWTGEGIPRTGAVPLAHRIGR